MIEILRRLAGRQQDGLVCDVRLAEAIAKRPQPMSGDDLVGYDHDLATAQQRQDFAAGARNQSRPDQDLIGAFAQIEMQTFDFATHHQVSVRSGVVASGQAASAAIARPTVTSDDPSPLSTTTLA